MKGKLGLFLRRRRFYVLPEVQLPLVLTGIAHAVVAWVVLATCLFGPLMIQLWNAKGSDPESVEAARSFMALHRSFWIPSAISIVLVVLSSIWVSHRIAGPLVRFRRLFRSVRDGRIPGQEQLRSGDLLKSEMAIINEMNAALRERQERMEQAGERIEEVMSRCESALRDANLAELEAAVEAVREESRRLQDALVGAPSESGKGGHSR